MQKQFIAIGKQTNTLNIFPTFLIPGKGYEVLLPPKTRTTGCEPGLNWLYL